MSKHKGISRRDLVSRGLAAAACGAAAAMAGRTLGATPATATAPAAGGKEQAEQSFRLVTVGRVEKDDKSARVRILDRYVPALKGLEGWSHAWVFYWFDKNDTPQKRGVLLVRPRGDAANPLTGVFACRAPVRPNLIALCLCQVLAVKDGVVTVDQIDAFDGTPVLDIKPYTPGPDRPKKDTRVPDWAAGGKKDT